MIDFTRLYRRLDATTKTNEKIAALVEYFASAEPEDAAWAIYFLSGGRLRRVVPTKLLRQWAAIEADIPDWLFDESYQNVGDLAETISLIVPPGQSGERLPLAVWVRERLDPLNQMNEEAQRQSILKIWRTSLPEDRFVMMKLITGAFRVGVSKRLVTRALSEYTERIGTPVPTDVVAHRLMGDWRPSEAAFKRLIDPKIGDAQISRPYPFCLAHPVDCESGPITLGDAREFLAEWKWDGIRGQVIRREGRTFVWSRGEELMERRWPEIEAMAECLPDGTVLDGEILASEGPGQVLPFAQLQRRIGRKSVGKKLLAEVPVIFHAFDLLEEEGADLRNHSLEFRRGRLENLAQQVANPHLCITELIAGDSWAEWEAIRENSRLMNAEGLMLKRRDGVYDVGRVRGNWWKWKVAPYTIDAVLLYAQKGHGRRSSLFTDYTFALWDDQELVPFAKAYSGLSDAEIRAVDQFIRQNTQESFGPVRSVTPQLVMELAFEGLQRSKRHKSGVATRFPRIVRWRQDKGPSDANQLNDLLELLPND